MFFYEIYYVNVDLQLYMYVIRMEFLSPSRRCSSSQNVPSGECDNVAVFRLLLFHFRSTCAYVIVLPWQRIFKGHAFWVLSFAACKLF